MPYKALLNETVKNISKVDYRNTEEINEIFQTALEDNENILLYYVVNMDNSSVFSDGWEAGLDYDFASLAFFSEPLKNKKFTYIEPEYDYVTEKLVIIMGTPVFDNNNEISGIAGVYINLDDVISAINEININSDDKNFLFLVDESGNIII